MEIEAIIEDLRDLGNPAKIKGRAKVWYTRGKFLGCNHATTQAICQKIWA